MTPTEQSERANFVQCAMKYIGTPYHHMGMIRGVGVDCATLLICAAQDAGLLGDDYKLDAYPADWHLHRGGERYLSTILKLCPEVALPPLPGDICLWRFARQYSHSAIVIEWPRIIHAYVGRPVSLDDGEKNQNLVFVGERGAEYGKRRRMKLLSKWSR